jgi:hypothetical protein
MSNVLNAMDGIGTDVPDIRIFTGNNCETIFSNHALLSRIPPRFPFHNPTLEQYQQKLDQFFTFYPEVDAVKRKALLDDIEKLLVPSASRCVSFHRASPRTSLSPTSSMCVRLFSSYVARYMFEPNYLEVLRAKLVDMARVNVPVIAK